MAQEVNVKMQSEISNGIRFHYTDLGKHQVTLRQFGDYVNRQFTLPNNHRFEAANAITDEQGVTHVHYNHFIDSILVLGSNVVGHFQNNVLKEINGNLRKFENATSPIVDKVAALEIAKTHSKATSFKWEFPEEEALLKVWKEDSLATYFPKGTLVLCPKDLDFKNSYALCYSFEINSDAPLYRRNIYVHCESGEVWAEEDLIHETNVTATANTRYRGKQTITTDSMGPGQFRLRETNRGNGIETYNMKKGTNYGAATDFTDTDNYWNNYNTNLDEIATDAHFGAEKTYDFYKTYFNRNSYDNQGAKIRSYVHYRSNYSNAFWNGSVMTYGDGNGSSITPLTSIDVCGHEVSHAVTTNSAGLIYRNESGALNESFSDIFGNAIEFYADSTQFNWRMGEDIMTSGNGFRNMANPKTHGDPSTYKGQYWYSGTGDNGGVHTNSGVQNYWFYLLSVGKTGKNDNGDNYTVDSIGIHKAQQIAYRNLTTYLTTSSDYAEARYYGIQSAVDLYGECSPEVEATTNAWYAVGVGDKYDSSIVVADFTSDTALCQASQIVQFKNKSTNAKSFVWTFSTGDTSHQANPTYQFPSQGSYGATLIATGCHGGAYDTIVKANYIKIDSTTDICNGYLLPKATWQTVHSCSGFIYDHNGEADYDGLSRDTLTITFGKCDSATIRFLELDYENKYDSIYVYDGSSTNATLIGGFTGKTLPFGGLNKTLYNGAVTITHFSDPYVVGTGFKAKFETFKQPLRIFKPGNQTACYNQTVTLNVLGAGGDASDHVYFWNGVAGNKSYSFTATQDTTIYILFGDVCMQEYITDSIQVKVLDPITFTQSNDTTVCQGNDATLNVNVKGGKNFYGFQTSDGVLSSRISPFSHTVTNLTPGQHDYWITFTDACTVSKDTAHFTITVRDSLQLQLSNDTTICNGTSVTVKTSANNGVAPYTYTWNGVSSSDKDKTYTLAQDTTIHVRLSDGCSKYEPTESVSIKVLDSLRVQLTSVDTACNGELISVKSSVSGGDTSNYTYQWMPTGSLKDKVLKITQDTVIGLVVSDGCTPKSGQAQIQIHRRSPLQLVMPVDIEICVGETWTDTVKASGGVTGKHLVSWSHGLGQGVMKSHAPELTTKYFVELSDQCSDLVKDSFQVVVHFLPMVDFDISPNPTCVGVPVNFQAKTNAGAGSEFEWNIDNKQYSTENVTYSYADSGKHEVSLKIKNENGCIDSLSMPGILEIQLHPKASFTYSPENPDFINRQTTFTNTSSDYTTSTWDVGGFLYTDNSPVHSFADSGSYWVYLKVENTIGCMDDTSIQIGVADAFVLYIPTAFSPNSDAINDQFRPIVRGMKEYNIEIFNRWGEVLWRNTNNSSDVGWDGEANGSRVMLGFYFYRITGTDIDGKEVERSGKFNVLY